MLSLYPYFLILLGNMLIAKASISTNSPYTIFDLGGVSTLRFDLGQLGVAVGFGLKYDAPQNGQDSAGINGLTVIYCQQGVNCGTGSDYSKVLVSGPYGEDQTQLFCDIDTYVYGIDIILDTSADSDFVFQGFKFCCRSLLMDGENCKDFNPLNKAFTGDLNFFTSKSYLDGFQVKYDPAAKGIGVNVKGITGLKVYSTSIPCTSDDNCSSCTQNDSCTSCNSAYYLDTSYIPACVTTCPSGYRKNTISFTCEACSISNCSICDNRGDECTECKDGYFQHTVNGVTTCENPCPAGYKEDTSATPEICKDELCVSNCGTSSKVCEENATVVSHLCTCDANYYKFGTKCIPCGSLCKTCDTTEGCKECKDNAELDDMKCECELGYGMKGSECSKCTSDLCETCLFTNGSETQCLTPKDSATCSGLSCECSAGYYKDDTNKVCVKCSTTFCKSCPNDVCEECEGNRVGETCACPSGYYGLSAICTPCSDQLCGKCSGGSSCDTCADNAEDESGVCVCKSGFYQSGSACLACDTDDPLVKCDESGENPTCKDNSATESGLCTCNSGYYNLSNECTACSDLCSSCNKASGCTECEPGAGNDQDYCDCTYGYYESTSDPNKVCLKCDLDLCEECDDSTACKVCVPNATLDSGACQCAEGYSPDSNFEYCIKCPYLCKTCDSSQICSECFNDAGDDLNECDCLKGYYYNNERCHACPSLCKSCGSFGCLLPVDNAECNSDGTSCSCIEGYYQASSQCLPCSKLCKVCTSSACGQDYCIENAELVNGECRCKVGFYEKDNACLPCGELCKECSDDTTCKKCADKAAIYLGKCSCTIGYYSKDDECVQCDELCVNCTETGCSECKAYAEMKNGSCVCEEGYYRNGFKCSKCYDPLCKTCDLTGDNCSACVNNATNQNDSCVCSPGYYQENSSCVRCPDLAASCASPFDNPLTNLLCKSNAVKTSNNLDCECKEGYFFWDYECEVCPGVLCKTCDLGICTDCTLDNAIVADGLCLCKAGFRYSSDDGGKCIACESLCKNCQHGGCVKCKSNSSLVNSVCICNDGFYYDSGENSCKPCNSACARCSSSASDCDSCVTNAVSDDTEGCVCTKSYKIDSSTIPGSCNYECPTSCSECDESGHLCTKCATGYLFWPEVNGCYSHCPTGYTETTVDDIKRCTASSTDIFEANLTDDKILTKTNNGFILTGTGVIPAYQRGWYFKTLNNYATLSPEILYGIHFSIDFWVFFESLSDYTLLRKESGTNKMQLSIKSTQLEITLTVESYDNLFEATEKSYTVASPLSQDTWYRVAISSKFDQGTTTLKVFIDNSPSTFSISTSLNRDIKSNLILGSNTAANSYFQGFIAYLRTANNDTVGSINQVPGTVPACNFTKVPLYSDTNTLSCESCGLGCTSGCANKETCSSSIDEVCTDLLCNICAEKFEICQTCKQLASKNTITKQCSCVTNATFDVDTQLCKCNFGYMASSTNDRCIIARDYLQSTDLGEAVYDTAYTQITLNFNREILRNQFSTCQELFISESYTLIGSDSTCTLAINNQSIVVILGNNSKFTTGDLMLNTLVLIGTRTDTRTAISPLTVTVNLVEGTNPTLIALITGPDIYSLSCTNNDLLLKGDGSRYNQRFGITYEWTVTGTGVAGSAASITGAASSLAIPPSQLKTGSLTVVLKIKNLNDHTDSASKTISIVGSPYLAVTTAANFDHNKKRNEEIVITLDVSNRCKPSFTLKYAWTFVESTNSDFKASNLASISTDRGTYTIPANTLPGPFTYTFKAIVTEEVSSDLSFTGETTIIINLTNEDLSGDVAFENWEENGAFSKQENLIIYLQLRNKYGFEVTYTWVCTRSDSNSCNQEVQDPTNPEKFSILENNLASYQNYTITVTATTALPDSRTLTKTLNLKAINSNPLATPLPAPYKPSAAQDLIFFPVITDEGAARFTWKNATSNTIWVTGNDRYENQELPLLIIPANTLRVSTDYHFELTVLNSDGVEIAYKTLLFSTNSPPSCGQSTISPSTGQPFITPFTLSVPGCTDDEDSDLNYMYFIEFEVGTNPVKTYAVKYGSKLSTYTTILNSYAKRWYAVVRDLKYDNFTSAKQDIAFSSNRMLNSEILNAYYQMTEDPENIPFATIMVLMADTLDRETIHTVKVNFDDYIKSVEYSKFSRELLVSVYKAIIDYQADILENSDILEMLELCYQMIEADGQVDKDETREIYYSVFEIISSRSEDHLFVAECIWLLEKIFLATLNNRPPSIGTATIDSGFYYQRLLGNKIQGLSLTLDTMNATLPNYFEELGGYKIYDFLVKDFPVEGLPILTTYLAEVGFYEQPNIVYYETKSLYDESDRLLFQFELPYTGTEAGLDVKCQIFSIDPASWKDMNCTAEIADYRVKIATSSIGIMRLSTVEQIVLDVLNEECEMNPAAFIIVSFWFGLMALTLIITFFTKSKNQELYKVEGIKVVPYLSNCSEKSASSPIPCPKNSCEQSVLSSINCPKNSYEQSCLSPVSSPKNSCEQSLMLSPEISCEKSVLSRIPSPKNRCEEPGLSPVSSPEDSCEHSDISLVICPQNSCEKSGLSVISYPKNKSEQSDSSFINYTKNSCEYSFALCPQNSREKSALSSINNPKNSCEQSDFSLINLPRTNHEGLDLLSRPEVEQVKPAKSNFLRQFILFRIFSHSDRFEKVISMLSLITVSLLGFSILGAFTYHYGDIDDDSEVSFSDIAGDYYPEDLRMVFIALALVIPAVLPIRLISKLQKVSRSLFVAFTVMILTGSVIGALYMGAIFCKGSMMRWTLSYLIFTPLELAISEVILAAVVHMAVGYDN